jgi:hypothetical protein
MFVTVSFIAVFLTVDFIVVVSWALVVGSNPTAVGSTSTVKLCCYVLQELVGCLLCGRRCGTYTCKKRTVETAVRGWVVCCVGEVSSAHHEGRSEEERSQWL